MKLDDKNGHKGATLRACCITNLCITNLCITNLYRKRLTHADPNCLQGLGNALPVAHSEALRAIEPSAIP